MKKTRKEQKILTIYVNLPDREFDIPHFLEGKPFNIAICPYSIVNQTLSDRAIEKITDLLHKKCLLVQRGYRGRCKYDHIDGTDPWHENLCTEWSNPSISLNEQSDIMLRGKSVLLRTFGFAPYGYQAPNHLWDTNTLKVVEVMPYKFIMDKNMIGLSMYNKHSVLVIPEVNILKDNDDKTMFSSGAYVAMDRLRDDYVHDYLSSIELITPFDISPERNSLEKLTINEQKKRISKMQRDLDNLL